MSRKTSNPSAESATPKKEHTNWGGARPNSGGARLRAGRSPESLHDRALNRVRRSPQLSQYESFIMADWPEGDEHLRWVLTASVREIVDWAIAGQS